MGEVGFFLILGLLTGAVISWLTLPCQKTAAAASLPGKGRGGSCWAGCTAGAAGAVLHCGCTHTHTHTHKHTHPHPPLPVLGTGFCQLRAASVGRHSQTSSTQSPAVWGGLWCAPAHGAVQGARTGGLDGAGSPCHSPVCREVLYAEPEHRQYVNCWERRK